MAVSVDPAFVFQVIGELEVERRLLQAQLLQLQAAAAAANGANSRSPVCPCGAYDERSHSEQCSLVSVAPAERQAAV